MIDSSGRKIGEVVSNSIKYAPLHDAQENKYFIMISGYITSKDVIPETVAEYELENLIFKNEKNLSLKTFGQFMAKFGFEKETEDFTPIGFAESYLIRYDSYLGNVRLRLLFKKNQLVAILHSRKLKNLGFEDLKLETTYILWIKKSEITAKKKFIQYYKDSYESGG